VDRPWRRAECPPLTRAFVALLLDEAMRASVGAEIDGVVLLRDRRLTPGRFADVSITEVDGYELVGESE